MDNFLELGFFGKYTEKQLNQTLQDLFNKQITFIDDLSNPKHFHRHNHVITVFLF